MKVLEEISAVLVHSITVSLSRKEALLFAGGEIEDPLQIAASGKWQWTIPLRWK